MTEEEKIRNYCSMLFELAESNKLDANIFINACLNFSTAQIINSATSKTDIAETIALLSTEIKKGWNQAHPEDVFTLVSSEASLAPSSKQE